MEQESENKIEENSNPEVIPKIISEFEEKPKKNKKYLIVLNIIVLIILATGIFYILKPSNSTEPNFSQTGKCGDGVCGEIEKANSKLCPQDCGDDSKTNTVVFSNNNVDTIISTIQSFSKDSPFGVLDPFSINVSLLKTLGYSEKEYFEWEAENIKELNIQYGRKTNLLRWELHEGAELDGNYTWNSETRDFDSDAVLSKINQYTGSEFSLILAIAPERNRSVAYIGADSEMEIKLQNFIKAAVERYNGDGVNDYNSNIKVKYWQVDNEPFIFNAWVNEKGGSIESYARYVELLSESVREIDPEAKIILGAEMSPVNGKGGISESIKKTIELLKNKNAIDIVDVHYWGQAENYKMEFLEDMRKTLDDNGYSEVEIWSCEFGTYVNNPNEKNLPYQSEFQQADGLIKRYTYNLAHDADKLFWTKLVDFDCYGSRGQTNFCGGMYDNMGLISDGANSGETSDLAGVKRLAYYSHRLFSEKLDGVDWNNIEIIQELNDIYVYKFTKNNKLVWVAWNDNSASQTISLNVGNINSVKITEAVPKYETGKEVSNFDSAFNTEIKNVNNGKITITLGETPVFIEED